jgi:hypothetical protein
MREPNYFVFTLTEMKKYVQMYREQSETVNWSEILRLEHRLPISFIHVVDDNDQTKVLAFAEWGWNLVDQELEFGKIEVKESLCKSGIGTAIMKMVFAIAKFYEAPRITGTIAGKKHLWHWYAMLGFTIHNQNKLLMDLTEP